MEAKDIKQLHVSAEEQNIGTFLCAPRRRGRDVEGMPVWWCPWIHDVTLLAGVGSRGLSFGTSNHLRDSQPSATAENPLGIPAVEKLLERVFLRGRNTAGSSGGAALADRVFASPQEAFGWVKQTAAQYPTAEALEDRVERIVMDLTEHLPAGHMLRVQTNPSGTLTLPGTIGGGEAGSQGISMEIS